jgi:hypothetical protein
MSLDDLADEIKSRVSYLDLYAFHPLENLAEICSNVRDAVAEARGRLNELTRERKIEQFLSVIKERLSECKSAFNNIIARNDSQISLITRLLTKFDEFSVQSTEINQYFVVFKNIRSAFMTKHGEMAERFDMLNSEVIEFVRKASDLSGPYTLSLIEE